MKRKLIVFLVVFIAFWSAGLFWFVTIIPTEPAVDKVNTDAIVVLTGGGLRMERGFELLAEGRAPRMFISGVEDGVTVASLLRNHNFADKVPPGAITLGYRARSTTGNASEVAEWVMREKVASIRLVTGNYHIPRSVNEIHQAVPDLIIISEPVFPRHFEDNHWWLFGDSTRLVISEYHKYLLSLLLHYVLQ